MIRPFHAWLAIAAAASLVACGDKPPAPAQTGAATAIPGAPPPPAGMPEAVPVPPAPGPAANPAETSRDSASTNPKGTMTKEQESQSMPMAGQANNHSSTALDANQSQKK
jgi:hypothetical protein